MAAWVLTGPWKSLFDTFRFARDGSTRPHQAGYEGLLTDWLLNQQRAGVRPGMDDLARTCLQLWEQAEREALGIHEDRLSATALREAWATGDILWMEHRAATGLFVEARWLVSTGRLSVNEVEWLTTHTGGRYRDADESLQLVAYRSPLAQGETPHTAADAALRRYLDHHLEQCLRRNNVPGALTTWQSFCRRPWWRHWYDLHITSRRVMAPETQTT